MNLFPDELGFIYLAETTTPDDNMVKNFRVEDKSGVFFVEFDTCLHSFDVMNRNSRMYEAANIAECLKTERIQHFLSHGGWFGEQNHPTPKYKNNPLSPERIQDIDMDNTSHKMLNPHIEGNLLVSKVQSDGGTRQGMNLAKKMVQGFKPGFSCRAIASMMLKNGKPTVNVRKIITYDWVLYQSHREAEQLDSVPTKFILKGASVASENTSEDVAIPLAEILRDTGKHDPTVQMIMESFELDDDKIVGITESKKQLILADNDNMIYCNIHPSTKKKVMDALLSVR